MTYPNQLKGVFWPRTFYKAALRYVRALYVLYSSIIYAKAWKFGSGGFWDFLAVKICHTKAIMTNTLDISTDATKLYQDDEGEKKKTVELEDLNRQKRDTGQF